MPHPGIPDLEFSVLLCPPQNRCAWSDEHESQQMRPSHWQNGTLRGHVGFGANIPATGLCRDGQGSRADDDDTRLFAKWSPGVPSSSGLGMSVVPEDADMNRFREQGTGSAPNHPEQTNRIHVYEVHDVCSTTFFSIRDCREPFISDSQRVATPWGLAALCNESRYFVRIPQSLGSPSQSLLFIAFPC